MPSQKTKCKGCGHPTHVGHCQRSNLTKGRRVWCACQHERPLTKRKRKQYTGKTRSRSCAGSGPRPLRAHTPKQQPSRKATHLNELYDHIIEQSVD